MRGYQRRINLVCEDIARLRFSVMLATINDIDRTSNVCGREEGYLSKMEDCFLSEEVKSISSNACRTMANPSDAM